MKYQGDLAAQGYVKVRMAEGGTIETLWAVRVAPDEDLFRLDNSPFYAYGVSYGDIVTAVQSAPEMYDFVAVVTRSGNRTVRLLLPDDADSEPPASKRILDGLVALGCSYEGAFSRTISMTVPSNVSLTDVAAYLVATGREWEYADPTYDDLFPED